MLNNKKINKSGGITLPAAIRREYGITAGDNFEVAIELPHGDIILRRNNGNCLFCGSSEKLVRYKGRFVCRHCVEMMKVEADRND